MHTKYTVSLYVSCNQFGRMQLIIHHQVLLFLKTSLEQYYPLTIQPLLDNNAITHKISFVK